LARVELPDHAAKLLIGAVARHPAYPPERKRQRGGVHSLPATWRFRQKFAEDARWVEKDLRLLKTLLER